MKQLTTDEIIAAALGSSDVGHVRQKPNVFPIALQIARWCATNMVLCALPQAMTDDESRRVYATPSALRAARDRLDNCLWSAIKLEHAVPTRQSIEDLINAIISTRMDEL